MTVAAGVGVIEKRAASTKRYRLGFVLRVGVSVGLMWYLLLTVGWRPLIESLRQADLGMLVLYVALGFLAIVVSAVKWLVLARSHNIDARLHKLVALYMVGYFFNQALPTGVGGDVARAYHLGRESGKSSVAWASVLMERFTGITALVILVVGASILQRDHLSNPAVRAAIGFALLAYAVGAAIVFSRSVLGWLMGVARGSRLATLLSKTRDVQDALFAYRTRRRHLACAFGLSFVFYGVSVAIVAAGCAAFGISVPVVPLTFVVVTMHLLFAFPISIGGIGLNEWAHYVMLAHVGVPGAIRLSLGLLYRVRIIAYALIGGVIYPFISGRDS
jgi:uncharacterized protein (TIRG00374 family)